MINHTLLLDPVQIKEKSDDLFSFALADFHSIFEQVLNTAYADYNFKQLFFNHEILTKSGFFDLLKLKKRPLISDSYKIQEEIIAPFTQWINNQSI